MPKIRTGRLNGRTIADPKIELLPKESAPANAPNKDIIGVPINRLKRRVLRLSNGKYSKKTIKKDNKINGNELKSQLINILIRTILIIGIRDTNIRSKEPSS